MEVEEYMKLDSQLCFPLYAASRKIVGSYTPYLRPLGITYTQYIMFLVLWEEETVTVGELCSKLHLDTGTVTPMLKKTESEGLIKRTRSKEDERVVVVTLTGKGRDLYDKAKDIPAKIGGCISIGKDEATALYKTLYKILGS